MYVQEIGRAGRDGSPATAILHFNAADLATNVPGMQDDMRDYCRAVTCKRSFIADYFMYTYELNVAKHDCCSCCADECKCVRCK